MSAAARARRGRIATTVRAIAILLLVSLTAWAGAARADDAAALEADALRALEAVFAALMTGDPEQVRPFLAPEYQVQRSDGVGYAREAYLARSIPKIEQMPTFRDLAGTRNGDIVVVRLMLEIDETINGKVAARVSPQLMVFRITPGGWQVVAAANFARLE